MFARRATVDLSAAAAEGDTPARNALEKAPLRMATSKQLDLAEPVSASRHNQAPLPGANRLRTSDPSSRRATRTRLPA